TTSLLSSGIDEKLAKTLIKDFESYGITQELADRFINEIEIYPEHIQARVPKRPEMMYKDTKELMKQCLVAKSFDIHALCKGPAGTGKNLFIKTLAYLLQKPLYEVSISGETDKVDLIGGPGLKDNNTIFEPSPLIEAMEYGGIYNLDEINFAQQSVTSLLHSVLDSRAQIEVPGYKLVTAKKGFLIAGTMNIGSAYHGVKPLNHAFADRFMHLEFEEPNSIIKHLEEKGANSKNAKILNDLYLNLKKGIRSEELSEECVTLRRFERAGVMADMLGLRKSIESNVLNPIDELEYKEAIELIVSEILMNS
ncbi:MAG: AAA family ATPase, partial [Peptostreptococcaceae bacterium]